MASAFVKIHEDRLTQVGNVGIKGDQRIRVISILGKARMGKSTFLNSIVSFLTQTDYAPFQTQDDDEHCTRGIDSYFLEKEGLVLLDCQGLSLEDSSHDPALLLFAYMVSDIIIFNERMMLQNEALKLLEPVCTFMTYIDVDAIKKPKLFFRISDGDIVKAPGKNLEKVLATYKDQYQSIRDSIKHLFQPEIGIVKTDALDRSAKNALAEGKYLSLLAEKPFGFESAITGILSALPLGHSGAAWLSLIPQIINGINGNSKITIDKLDLVSQTAKLELVEWINAIPKEIYDPIHVDQTQATFEANVETRKASKKALLTSFTRKFKHIAAEIKDPYYRQIDEQLSKIITKATESTLSLANQAIAELFEKCKAPKMLPPISSALRPICEILPWVANIFYDCNVVFKTTKILCTFLYQPVYRKVDEWLGAQCAVMEEAMKKVAQMEEAEKDAVEKTCARIFAEASAFAISVDASNLYASRNSIITDHLNKVLECAVKEISACANVHEILFEMKDEKLTFAIHNRGNILSMNFDLIKHHYDKLVENLKTLYTDSTIHKTINVAKHDLLDKHTYTYHTTTLLKDEKFACIVPFTGTGQKEYGYFVTVDTYKKTIQPVIGGMLQRLVAKGYMKAGTESEYVSFTEEGNIVIVKLETQKLNRFLSNTFFVQQFGKALMRAEVAGVELPTCLPEHLCCRTMPGETVLSIPTTYRYAY